MPQCHSGKGYIGMKKTSIWRDFFFRKWFGFDNSHSNSWEWHFIMALVCWVVLSIYIHSFTIMTFHGGLGVLSHVEIVHTPLAVCTFFLAGCLLRLLPHCLFIHWAIWAWASWFPSLLPSFYFPSFSPSPSFLAHFCSFAAFLWQNCRTSLCALGANPTCSRFYGFNHHIYIWIKFWVYFNIQYELRVFLYSLASNC